MTLPNIPTGFNQLIIVICIGIIVYNYQEINSSAEKFNQFKTNELLDGTDFEKIAKIAHDSAYLSATIFINKMELKKLTKKVFDTSKSIANIKNIDSIKIVLTELENSISRETDSLSELSISLLAYNLNKKSKLSYIDSESKRLKQELNQTLFLIIIILPIFFMALYNLAKAQSVSRQLGNIELYKSKIYQKCQSCAKVFSPKLLHGKNKDGTINIGFCEECYQDGNYTNPELTADEVIAEIKKLNPNEKDVDKKVNQMIRWNQNLYTDNYKF